MYCPFCDNQDSCVIDSRVADKSSVVRRRRECSKCKKRWTTYERVEGLSLFILKKDGSKEPFSREKLKKGIVKSTWKRPIEMGDIDDLVDEIEKKLRKKETLEIKSWEVGNLVINRLKKLDPLSYLSFASVYRGFDSLEAFQVEIEKLLAKQK